MDMQQLAKQIKKWGNALGFEQVGISNIDTTTCEPQLRTWLEKKYHGQMDWMASRLALRLNPTLLHEGTLRIISVSMPYLTAQSHFTHELEDPNAAYISRYALGRDYHKVLRQRLKQLGDKISLHCQQFDFRPFVDSAPVLERHFAQQAGLGWTGKNSLLIHPQQGSCFFIGELFVNLPLPVDNPITPKCGKCTACLQICPTQAIIAPSVIDATRCISYLTIEYNGIIPEVFRPLIGNRIYGCDDCQLICPWNEHVNFTQEKDFTPRKELQTPQLLALYSWNEQTFLTRLNGSAIRRIGYWKWLRNITIALGNAPYAPEIEQALRAHLSLNDILDIHIHWALAQQQKHKTNYIPNRKTARLVRNLNRQNSRNKKKQQKKQKN